MLDAPRNPAVSNPPTQGFAENLNTGDLIRRSATMNLPPPERQLTPVAKLIDVSKCIGCKACQTACMEWNDLRDGIGTTVGVYDNPADLFVAGFIGAPAMNFFHGSIEATGEGALFFRSPAFEAPIVPNRFSGLAPGLPVVAGLRPDDIVPVGHGMAPARPVAAQGTVILAEMLGGESQVLLRLGETEAIARMGNPRPVVTDEKLSLALDIERLHLFATSTGRTLRSQADVA